MLGPLSICAWLNCVMRPTCFILLPNFLLVRRDLSGTVTHLRICRMVATKEAHMPAIIIPVLWVGGVAILLLFGGISPWAMARYSAPCCKYSSAFSTKIPLGASALQPRRVAMGSLLWCKIQRAALRQFPAKRGPFPPCSSRAT